MEKKSLKRWQGRKCMLSRKSLRCNNFTLIELLVVIGIIAILAAMLLPALSNVRAKAKEITCVGNMKNISQALLMYSQDFSGYLPKGTYVASFLYNYTTLGGIGDYLNVSKDYQYNGTRQYEAVPISFCLMGGRDGTQKVTNSSTQPNFSYSISDPQSVGEPGYPVEPLTNVKNPDGRLLLGESGIDGWYNLTTAGTANGLYNRSRFGYRHNRRANIFYVDCHYESLKPGEVSYYYNSAANDPKSFYCKQNN